MAEAFSDDPHALLEQKDCSTKGVNQLESVALEALHKALDLESRVWLREVGRDLDQP